ncbi:titin homolog isoform X1 [Nothobranchius furzeri]|uniref:Transcript variant X1 n=2 Tax=Nothobranchius furzeri TaxID=105023 RepID=A0A9D2YG55_NOTFU|nr:transcript variant X1 [Nothobranchius furzeri]
MASPCKKQQCTIDRRGFRQELDSWKHKLLHCVGFESILEGLIGPELVEDLKVFKDFEPVSVSDWSFKENCLFCWLRRDKVKEHLIGLHKGGRDDTSKPLLVKDQLSVIRLEKQAEEFLHAVLSRKDAPNSSDPLVPIVAREVLQKMISQLAAEYISKPSSPQDSRSDSPPHSDQSLPAPLSLSGAPPTTTAATVAGPAHNQNPVLSKLLMADQDAPLDLTIKKPPSEPTEQDGVLDLSIKKNHHSNSSLPGHSPCFSPSAPKSESPDFHIAKAKDLQSTSTLEQFMSKLCSHHQKQIVDAIGFLQTEVKAHASSKASNSSAAGTQGASCLNENSSRAIPDKSLPELKPPCESTPKAELQETTHSLPKSCALKKISENMVSLNSSADSALDIFCLESENNQPQAKTNSVDGDNKSTSDHAPLKMKIMANSAAAGKKLSCVLDGSLSSHSEAYENHQSNTNSSGRGATHRARLNTSVKRRSPVSLLHHARPMDIFEHPKDTPAKVFPVHVTIPSDSAPTARKTARTLSEHQIRDSLCKDMVDPDFGHRDIVFIDKPITECFHKKRRSLVPRRNARKSTRGHMYSDEIWELKTVRTLAGRGNCPNPIPQLITLVTPKQILSKPEGVPPVDMAFAGECTETVNQQMPTEESESLTPGAGDVVEIAASKADVVVEMSQTDQCEKKGQASPPSPLNLPSENKETHVDTYAESEKFTDSGITIQNAEVVEQPMCEATKDTQPEAQQVSEDNAELTIAETEVEPPENITTKEAEPQPSPDKLLSSDPLPQQTDSSSAVSQTEEGMEEDKEETIEEVQQQELQPDMQIHHDNCEDTNMLTAEGSAEEPVEKQPEIQTPEAAETLNPVETNANEDSYASKSLDAPLKKVSRKKRTKMLLPESMRENETNIVGYVNGKPVSASDRSLRHRAGNSPISLSKTMGTSSQNEPTKPDNSPDLTIGLLANNEKLEKSPPQNVPLETVDTPLVTQQLTEPSSDTSSSHSSKLPSKTPKSQRRKIVLRSKVQSNHPADQGQSAIPKRQLRSTSQKLTATPTSTPASNVITSISPPTPSTLILPPAEQLPPLLVPHSLPITTFSLNRSSESSSSKHLKQRTVSKTVEHTQSIEISEDTQNTHQAETYSEDTHSIQPAEANSEDPHVTHPTETYSEDTRSIKPAEANSEDTHSTHPAETYSDDTQIAQSDVRISEDTHSSPATEVIGEVVQKNQPVEAISQFTQNTLLAEVIPKDKAKPQIDKGSETKPRLRSSKAVTDSINSYKEQLSEDSSPLVNLCPAKTETQPESLPLRSKRVLRKNSDAGYVSLIQKKDENRSAGGDDGSPLILDKPKRMPLRSETIKIETSQQSDNLSPPENKKLSLRSQRSNTPANAFTDSPKQSSSASSVRAGPERVPKAQMRPYSVLPSLHNTGLSLVPPKQEPPKQTVNKFLQSLTGEANQNLINNMNNKYDKMLKGWVQMDKEGQPSVKNKNRSDRQAAIWKSKRRTRKSKSFEQQKYSPVQMLFMKGFDLTSICHWFLESTETKSLVIVKKVNTRLPSETQLCFHSSSVSGPSQGVFPSLQAERLKKHLKKFAIASPVKSNPKSLKLIAKALEQEANAVKGKERTELPCSMQALSKPPSSDKACPQKVESQKSSGTKNPASARILRKYSNIREKMQVQHTTVRLKGASKLLTNKKMKTLAATKSADKPQLKSSMKGQKPTILVSKKMKESAAKLERRTMLAAKSSAKYSVKKKTGKAQGVRTPRNTNRKEIPKRSSQRLGSPKISEPNSSETSKNKLTGKKQNEADKLELEKSEVNKVNSVKNQAAEPSSSSVAESKVGENAAEVPQQIVGEKAPASPDQVLTRSQRKMEAEVPPSGSLNNVSKRVKKSKSLHTATSKAVAEVDKPKLTRSGAIKRCQTSSLPRNITKGATKRAQEPKETPAKRTRTK